MTINTAKLKNTFLNFIVPIIAITLTLVALLAVVYPAVRALPRLTEELKATSDLENQLKTKLTTLNKMVDFEAVVAENANVLHRVLVSEASVPQLLTQIDIIAKASGLTVNKLSYSFGEASEEDAALPYSTVNVSLGATGNYAQINTFLKNLENGARLIDVSTFRFSSEKTEETTGLFNVTFILRSPYLHVESSAATDEPVDIDVADPTFVSLLDQVKELRFYDITIDTKYEDIEESTPEEIEESIEEEEVPQDEVTDEELQEIIDQSE